MSFLASIFNSFRSKGVTYGPDGIVTNCLFCDINARKEPGTIVRENEEFVTFRTVRPYTDSHFLVVPRTHLKSVDNLRGEQDAMLVQRMVDAGKDALEALQPGLAATASFCFHVPPFNSIDHLHLHAIGNADTMGVTGRLKYSTSVYCWDSATAMKEIRARLS